MDETKLRAILHEMFDYPKSVSNIIRVDNAIRAIQALLPPKIPVYDPEDVADALENVGANDGVFDIHLQGP